jgi:eukaryotic-like serine/threonine-protein kinase
VIGTTLGRYRIESVLGAGGMGVVYRASDTELGRPVAIKVLASDLNQDNRRRLLHEARSASALNDPHICTVHEVGEAEGCAFLVMELVEGRVLRDVIPTHGFPTETVIHYGAQIAAALAHAHERGIIHRDLKTGNVVVTENGRAKVLDFGIAQRINESPEAVTEAPSSTSLPGTAIGTLAYMAPELFQAAPADQRSDIWALGVVLYEMATGKAPFQAGTSFELVSAILRDPVPRLPSSVSTALASVIQRCLAREPGRRYQRASEVESALEPLAHSASAEPVPAMPVPRLPARRWWLVSAAVVLSIVAFLIATNVGAMRDRLRGAAVGAPSVRALVVLPLDNLSRDSGQDYFADGMTESLISSLAQIRAPPQCATRERPSRSRRSPAS